MEGNNYQTADFCLATFIYVAGYSIIKIDKTNPKRMIFSFRIDSNLLKAVKDFNDGKATVEPKDFFSALKEIKTRIHNQ